jgi:hypothetical protein
MKKIFVILLAISDVFSQQLWDGTNHIPSSYRIDWTNAGLLPYTPSKADHILNVTDYGALPNDGQDDFDAINNAIMDAGNLSGVSIIYFPSGHYTILASIVLKRESTNEYNFGHSNIIFQGKDANSTFLEFIVGENQDCFYIYGIKSGAPVFLDGNSCVEKGDKIIYGSFSHLSAGDWIYLCEEKLDDNYPSSDGYVGQITQVIKADSNSAKMKDEASKEYKPENNLWIQRILPVMNIGIENLSIKRMDLKNGSGRNLLFKYSVNCWVKGVELDYACYSHISIFYSSHIEVSGCFIHHARSYGKFWLKLNWPPVGFKGTGYGIILGYGTTNCLIENNIFKKLRHAIIAGCGANCNVCTYNYSTEQVWPEPVQGADICLHGRYPYANLFEQNYIEFIHADGSHGKNGPYNAFIRNFVYNAPSNAIVIKKAHKSSVLGNICKVEKSIEHSCRLEDIECGKIQDIFGCLHSTDGYDCFNHHYVYDNHIEDRLMLLDQSCYYSQRPGFLPKNFTWPSLGPRVSDIPCSQNIPAKERYHKSGRKTFLIDPIKRLDHLYY